MASGGFDDIEVDAAPCTEEEEKLLPTNEEYLSYIEWMPANLKYCNFDILILHDEKDFKEVRRFQRRIVRDCFVTVANKRRQPNVRLEDECEDQSSKSLDYAFSKALYIFLFVTQTFCKHELNLHRGYSILVSALEEKRWSVIPVYTEDKETRKRKGYKLPMMLNSLKPINYWDKNFYREAVCKLLDSRVNELAQMDIELERERKEYFYQNKDQLQKYRQAHLKKKKYPQMLSRNLSYPIQEQNKTSSNGRDEMSKSHSEAELVLKHTSLEDRDLTAHQDSPPESFNYNTFRSPTSLEIDTRENLQNVTLVRSNADQNCSPLPGRQTSTQELPARGDVFNSTAHSPATFLEQSTGANMQTARQHLDASPHSICGGGHQETCFDLRGMANDLADTMRPDRHQNVHGEPGFLENAALGQDIPSEFLENSIHPPSSTTAEPPTSVDPESGHFGCQPTPESIKTSVPDHKPPQNSYGQADATQESVNVQHHHHHHHYHKHFKIGRVENMAVGEHARIKKGAANESPGQSSPESFDDESSEEFIEEGNNTESNEGYWEETSYKTSVTKQKDKVSCSESPPEFEETHVKTVDDSLPSDETQPKGFPELTSSNRKNLFQYRDYGLPD